MLRVYLLGLRPQVAYRLSQNEGLNHYFVQHLLVLLEKFVSAKQESFRLLVHGRYCLLGWHSTPNRAFVRKVHTSHIQSSRITGISSVCPGNPEAQFHPVLVCELLDRPDTARKSRWIPAPVPVGWEPHRVG